LVIYQAGSGAVVADHVASVGAVKIHSIGVLVYLVLYNDQVVRLVRPYSVSVPVQGVVVQNVRIGVIQEHSRIRASKTAVVRENVAVRVSQIDSGIAVLVAGIVVYSVVMRAR